METFPRQQQFTPCVLIVTFPQKKTILKPMIILSIDIRDYMALSNRYYIEGAN